MRPPLCLAPAVIVAGIGLLAPSRSAAQPPQSPNPPAYDARVAAVDAALKTLLTAARVGVPFEAEPDHAFRAHIKDGLKNTESLEILLSIQSDALVHFTVYPHLPGGAFLNVDKVSDKSGLMKAMLSVNDQFGPFLFAWGVDDDNDSCVRFSIATNAGFPADEVVSIIRNIRVVDRLVGDLRPFIDGRAIP